jgi:hypothetical protein
MGYVGLIALFVIGVMMFWKPELMWKIEHLLSVKGGEPTDFYLSMMRIGGVVFAVISVILAISFW